VTGRRVTSAWEKMSLVKKFREIHDPAAQSRDDRRNKTHHIPTQTMKLTYALIGSVLSAGLASAAVIADFSAEFPVSSLGGANPYSGSETPATGWDYMWNPNGVIGTASGYQSLVPNTVNTFPGGAGGGVSPLFTNLGNVAFNDLDPEPNGQGNFVYGRVGLTSFHPGVWGGGLVGDIRGIIAYTIQSGEAGTVSIANSSFAKLTVATTSGANGVDLDIYVNDTLIGALSKDGFQSLTASNFDGSLGDLSVGDTVYVTIGNNGNDSFDASVIDFQLVSVPEPSAALLGGLGMLALLRRRRA
jgi:hypothetical protein